MTKPQTAVLFVLLVALGIGLFFVSFDDVLGNQEITGDFPEVEFFYSAMSANTTQGGSVSINCTVINLSQNRSVLEGLGIQLLGMSNQSYTIAEGRNFFNQSFTPNPVLIEAQGQATAVLTITFSDDAPVGTYYFSLQGVEESFELTVTQKTFIV
ncbi:MAG: hypothetical protein ACQCN3_00940 [Candidatus Bathyarchaeia archaeon]|jgi:hypothetical protein